jgi:ribonuclease D
VTLTGTSIEVFHGDLDDDVFEMATAATSIGWDIETSGLDWRNDTIGTCQLSVEDRVLIVIPSTYEPRRLRRLLENSKIRKVFHHAPFDLRFMVYQWKAQPKNIACTKVAAKILNPNLAGEAYSLKPVLRRFLAVNISKDQQVSDWLAPTLTTEQLTYAAADVLHLVELCHVLRKMCRDEHLEDVLIQSWNYLPTRVSLDLRGSGDVFAY